MKNLTRKLHSFYKHPPKQFIPSLKVGRIREQIILVRNHLTKLRTALHRQRLPFTRTNIPNLIGLKLKLSQEILKLETCIREIDCAMSESIRNYFNAILKTIIIDYRQSEEKHLLNLQNIKYDNTQMLVTLNDAEKIKQSIFFLTTMLMEIKLVVYAQREKLDRIDEYLDSANIEIEKTNNELKDIPKKHNRVKNRIVYFMTLFLVMLLFIAIVKAERTRSRRGRRNRRSSLINYIPSKKLVNI